MSGVNYSSTYTMWAGAGTIWTIGGAGDSKYGGDFNSLPDLWERNYFGNRAQTSSGDWDGGGLSNLTEYQIGSNPTEGVAGSDLLVFTPLQ